MLYKGLPQPWRGWVLALSVVIAALFILEIVVGFSWVLLGGIVVLIGLEWWLVSYAKRHA